MTRIDETIKKHDKGYNCAQAIACTYCDLVGMDEETMFKVAEGCKNSTGNLDKPNSKASTYKLSREIMQKFKEKNSTTTCKVLKGVETGKLLRTCPDCIRDAAAIVEEVLFSEE